MLTELHTFQNFPHIDIISIDHCTNSWDTFIKDVTNNRRRDICHYMTTNYETAKIEFSKEGVLIRSQEELSC